MTSHQLLPGYNVIEMCTESDEATSVRSWWLENEQLDMKLQVVVQRTFVKNGSDRWGGLVLDVRSQQAITKFAMHDPEPSIDAIGVRALKLAIWALDAEDEGEDEGEDELKH